MTAVCEGCSLSIPGEEKGLVDVEAARCPDLNWGSDPSGKPERLTAVSHPAHGCFFSQHCYIEERLPRWIFM